jgi:hypothetical protein
LLVNNKDFIKDEVIPYISSWICWINL